MNFYHLPQRKHISNKSLNVSLVDGKAIVRRHLLEGKVLHNYTFVHLSVLINDAQRYTPFCTLLNEHLDVERNVQYFLDSSISTLYVVVLKKILYSKFAKLFEDVHIAY